MLSRARGGGGGGGDLWLHARHGAAHDEAVPPHAAVPLGPDAFDLHICEARLGEPLQAQVPVIGRHLSRSDFT